MGSSADASALRPERANASEGDGTRGRAGSHTGC
jgi:hypothetical protein